MPNYKLKSIWN